MHFPCRIFYWYSFCSFFILAITRHRHNTFQTFTLCIFVLGFLANTFSTLTPSSSAPLPPTAASLLGSLHLSALQ